MSEFSFKDQFDLSWILDRYLHSIDGKTCILPSDTSLEKSFYFSENTTELKPIECSKYDISPWVKADRDHLFIKKDETYVLKIENGHFIDDTSMILAPDAQTVLRHQSLDYVYCGTQWKYQQQNLTLQPKQHLSGNVLLLNSTWGSEYSHFIYSVIGRYLKFLTFPVLLDEIDYFILPENKSFISEWIEILKIPSQKIIHLPSGGNNGHSGNIFSADNLYIPSSAAPGDIKVIAFLRNTLLNNHIKKEPKRLLFLSRERNQNLRGRYIINTNELFESILKKYGFELIIEEDLNFFEKAALFNDAKVVITSHGSGPIVHAAFMQKKSTLIEIFPEHWLDFCLPNITQFIGVNYYYHVAHTVEHGNLFIEPDKMSAIINKILPS